MSDDAPVRLRRYVIFLGGLWTVAILIYMLWNIVDSYQDSLEFARLEARSTFNKDLSYRRWAAMHGGVYVPATEKTPPNPFLEHVAERDIKTASGVLLTFVNPAYMTKQVHAVSANQYGVRGHITSLKPLNPENLPDDWEAAALNKFEEQAIEFSQVVKIDGKDYMRLMSPALVEARCMKCHKHQGYKIGDVRGGISVSVPMSPHRKVSRANILSHAAWHSFFWLVGLWGLSMASMQLKRRLGEREKLLHDMGERVKELHGLYGVAVAIHNSTDMDNLLDKIAKLLPPAWHYPDITRGRVILDEVEHVSDIFEVTRWMQKSDIVVHEKHRGSVEVYYLKKNSGTGRGSLSYRGA